MLINIGQRWEYTQGDFYILAEITDINPIQTLILASNAHAESWGYKKGAADRGGMGLDEQGGRWHYLSGQDKPEDHSI